MRLTAGLCAVLLSLVLLTAAFASPSSAYVGTGGLLTADGKMTLTGLTSLEGSGTMTLNFSGVAATELRLRVFTSFDLNSDEYLDIDETRVFLDAVSGALVGKIYYGVTITSATSWTLADDDYVVKHTKGLVNFKYDSGASLVFDVKYEGSGEARTKVIELGQSVYDCFAMAISETVDYAFNGTLVVSQRVTAITVGSFTSPNITDGKVSAIRAPFGEIVWYSFSGYVGPGVPIVDDIAYKEISLMENQQLSFVVLFIGAIIMLRMPGRFFDKYEKLHPRKFRKYAKPLMPVTISSWLVVAVVAAFYLFPFMFSFASPNAIFYSAYLYILIPLVAIGEYFFARFMYKKASLEIPDESIIEVKQAVVEPEEGLGEILCKACYRPIEASLEMLQCGNCGANMHLDCGEKAQNCPSCGQNLFPERTRSIECRSCGESFMYSGLEDPYSIQCPNCGAFQEEIAAGKNYLVSAESSRNAYMMIRALMLSERPTLCLTTEFPGKVRSEYELGPEVSIKRFSDTMTDIDNITPKDLEGDSMEVVSTFLMTTKKAGVLLEGIDMLVETNGFDKVLTFIKKLNDLASTHGSTVILALDKKKLTEDQFKAISDDFDEIHDYQ